MKTLLAKIEGIFIGILMSSTVLMTFVVWMEVDNKHKSNKKDTNKRVSYSSYVKDKNENYKNEYHIGFI